MDGVGGFEPPNDWTKTNCLAAWLYPNLKLKIPINLVVKVFNTNSRLS